MQGIDYGNEYYAEESDESPAAAGQYYTPGAMFQQQQKAAQQIKGAGGYGQAVNSASGVPFYG